VVPAAAQLGNATIEARVLETPQGVVCPAAEQLEITQNVIRNELLVAIRERVYHHLLLPPLLPQLLDPLMNVEVRLDGLVLH